MAHYASKPSWAVEAFLKDAPQQAKDYLNGLEVSVRVVYDGASGTAQVVVSRGGYSGGAALTMLPPGITDPIDAGHFYRRALHEACRDLVRNAAEDDSGRLR